MAKKMYDIIPVKVVERKEEDVESVGTEEVSHPIKTRKTFSFSKWWLLGIVFAFLLGIYFFVEGKAEVQISPKTEDFSVEEVAVTINSMESIIDYEKNVVPGIVFSDSKDFSEEYQATGTDDKAKKSTGTIKVYNKINPAKPISLIKGTRFLSESGLIYRADANFTVPAGKVQGGSFVGGSVEINVTAAEAGEKYNLSKATFSVPGLNGTEYYSNIWAETVTALSGGEESSVKIVTREDINSNEGAFEDKYIAEARQALINNVPKEFMYFEEYINPKMENISASAKEKEEIDKFTISGKTSVQATVFRKEDMASLGQEILKKQLSELKTIVPESVVFDVTEKKLNKDGKIEMKVVFKCKTYSMPENSIIMDSLLGKDKNNALLLLSNIPEIEKSEIKISPFWKWRIPKTEERVDVKINFGLGSN
ncbi:MAG: hypothetical protein PHD31_01200 [Candidatus Pacebacteria bacterium]|nr:hypothetical protein [Candidatus Paceibacterota bacterium]